MSFLTINIDLKYVGQQVRRCADALEAIAGPPPEPIEELKPADAVTYVDEERDAEREEAERLQKLGEWLQDHPEEEGIGEGDIHGLREDR